MKQFTRRSKAGVEKLDKRENVSFEAAPEWSALHLCVSGVCFWGFAVWSLIVKIGFFHSLQSLFVCLPFSCGM